MARARPQPFYEHYGFVPTGEIKWDEIVLRLDLDRRPDDGPRIASTDAGARALERLGDEPIGWLTTVNPDGQPQSSPIWFLWVDDEILVYSRTRAPRNENIRERPLVSFNLNTDPAGDDVVTMEGTARIDPDGGAPSAEPGVRRQVSGDDRRLRLDVRATSTRIPGRRAHHADALAGRLTPR